jgi:hypothetical protein
LELRIFIYGGLKGKTAASAVVRVPGTGPYVCNGVPMSASAGIIRECRVSHLRRPSGIYRRAVIREGGCSVD